MGLVLSRKQGESITVGDVTITIAKLKGASVRIKIDAPKDVKIMRTEVIDRATVGTESDSQDTARS